MKFNTFTTTVNSPVCDIRKVPSCQRAWQQLGRNAHFMVLERPYRNPCFTLDTNGLSVLLAPYEVIGLEIEYPPGTIDGEKNIYKPGSVVLLPPGRYPLSGLSHPGYPWKIMVLTFDAKVLLQYRQLGFFHKAFDSKDSVFRSDYRFGVVHNTLKPGYNPFLNPFCVLPLIFRMELWGPEHPNFFIIKFVIQCLKDHYSSKEIGTNPWDKDTDPMDKFVVRALRDRPTGRLPSSRKDRFELLGKLAAEDHLRKMQKVSGPPI